MRVRIDENMKICPWGQMLELKAGEEADGPLARWLAEDSGCPVTVLEPETEVGDGTEPQAQTDEAAAADEGQESEPDGALSADLTAASTAAVAPKAAASKSGAKGK